MGPGDWTAVLAPREGGGQVGGMAAWPPKAACRATSGDEKSDAQSQCCFSKGVPKATPKTLWALKNTVNTDRF